MNTLLICSGFGLALAVASTLCDFSQAHRSVSERPLIAFIMVMALWPFFSLLSYAWASSIPAFTASALLGVLEAFGCGLAFCLCGLIMVMLKRFIETGESFSWPALLRTVNVPWYLVLLLMFSGLIYERWFRFAAVR